MRKPNPRPLSGVTAESSAGPGSASLRFELNDGELHLPAPLAEPRAVPFPVVMAVAPVVVSIALWLLLGSPAMLAFAVLGPALAVANYVEARRQVRAEQARALASFDRELHTCVRQAAQLAREDLVALHRSAPGARALVAGERELSAVSVSLGFGSVRARIQVRGELRDLPPSARRELENHFTHREAPVLPDAARVAVSGPHQLVLAAGRALLLQGHGSAPVPGIARGELASLLARELAVLGMPWSWIDAASGSETGPRELLLDLRGAGAPVSRAESSALPAPVVRLQLEDTSSARVELSGGQRLTLRPAFVTAEEMRACSLAWLDAAGTSPPSDTTHGQSLFDGATVQAEAAVGQAARGPSSLHAVLGTSGGAPFGIDLVRAGPHAVIGGTTGSGKSELLMTWVLAMTEARSTREVQILCFDFKGGATFDPIASLPHCVGIVTDLDASEARRAAISLGAEVRERELALRAAGVADIGQLPGLPRLVILVDEYQALVDAGADLQELFADISARGRSLGMHLVLCAQQPAVAVRGATLANCGVRVCLRVISDADSTALLGSASAARLPAASPGRALVAAGDRITEIQVEQRERRTIARLTEAAVEREAHLGYASPGRPWLPALPPQIKLAELASDGTGVAFGVLDDTLARRQSPARLDTALGALVVIGGPRTGKSACLAVLVEAARAAVSLVARRVVVLDSDVESAWDQLFADDLTAQPGLLVIDDIDVLLAGIEEPHRTAVIEKLERLVRHSASASPALVFSLSRVTGGTAPLVSATAQTLRLVGGDRAGFVMAGGEARDHRAGAPPGRAVWRGLECQVARATEELRRTGSGLVAFPDLPAPSPADDRNELGNELLVVARQRTALRRVLEGRGFECIELADWRAEASSLSGVRAGEKPHSARPRAVIGDPEGWQSQFGALSRLSTEHHVLLSGVTPGEHRAFFRGDPLPPLTTDSSRSAVLRDTEGRMVRIRWSDPEPGMPEPGTPESGTV